MNVVLHRPARVKAPRPKPPRFIRVLEQPGPDTEGWAAVEITVGKQVDTYLLRTIPTELESGALAFEVEKLSPDFETAETYHVHLGSGPATCSCDCMGHEQHGHCKHREGIETLVKLGKLPVEAPRFRSAGDVARNDPDAFAQHEADLALVFTPRRAKDAADGPDIAA